MRGLDGIVIGIIMGIGYAHWALWPSRADGRCITPNSIVGAFIARLMTTALVATGVILLGGSIYAVSFGMIGGYFGRLIHWLRREAVEIP